MLHSDDFKAYFGPDQADLAAKVANQALANHAVVLYGVALEDGSCSEFSTEQTKNCTHVCIALGIQAMGALPPSKAPIKRDEPTRDDDIKAMREYVQQLEQRLKQKEK